MKKNSENAYKHKNITENSFNDNEIVITQNLF